jgi:hypothetical protein
MAKKKTLAQLEIGSKAWDEEMLRQNPGWGTEHAEAGIIDKRFDITKKRIERLTGQKELDNNENQPGLPDDL